MEATHEILVNGSVVARGDGAAMFARMPEFAKVGGRLVKVTSAPASMAPAAVVIAAGQAAEVAQREPGDEALTDSKIAAPSVLARAVASVAPGIQAVLRADAAAAIPGVTVDQDAAERIRRQEAACRAIGILPPTPYFAAGTVMMASGEAVFHSMKQAFNDLPPAREAIGAVIERIESEHRRDVVIDSDSIGLIRMEGGRIKVGKRYAALTVQGLQQLLSRYARVFPAAQAWALQMGSSALDAAVTDGFARLARMAPEARPAMTLRVRDEQGEAAIWAVVGPQFPGRATDGDAVLRAALPHLSEGTRAEATYDPNTSRSVVRIVHFNEQIVNPRVGDVFRASISGSTRDDGRGAFSGRYGIERILCINCTVGTADLEAVRKIHSRSKRNGDSHPILDGVNAVFQRGPSSIAPLLDEFRAVRHLELGIEVDGVAVTKPGAMFDALLSSGDYLEAAVKDAGIARDVAAEVLLRGWQANVAAGDVDGSMADLVNAVSKAAQDKLLDAFQRDGLERAAGHLLHILARPMVADAEAK